VCGGALELFAGDIGFRIRDEEPFDMVTIQTDLRNLKEPARRERFEPTGNRRRTQGAIQQVYTVAAGKVAQVGMARLPVAAASINILSSDIEVGIDSGSAATTLTLSPNNPLEHDLRGVATADNALCADQE
jgi:hypothetical protein